MKRHRLVRGVAGLCMVSVIAGSAAGCTSGRDTAKIVNTKRYETMSFSPALEEDGIAAENDTWRLYWDSRKKQVSFEEKATGTRWGPVPAETDQSVLNEDEMPFKNHPQIESAVQVYYHNPATQEEKVALSSTDAASLDGVYAEKIDGGLRVTYDFMELEISVPIEYTIEKDRFLITVHPEQISDNGESVVTAVALAPFLCGVQNNREDAWLFLPDGSGTLIAPHETGTVGSIGSADVYGGDLSVQQYEFLSSAEQVHLPVFGVKKGKSALLAVIDSGAESSSLMWNIGSGNIRYSSVYPVFHIRGYSLIEAPKGFSSPLTEIKVFSKGVGTTPLRVAGYSLSGDSADIAGMARTYRQYLIKYKGMERRSDAEKNAAFKFVGALEQPQFILGLPSTELFSLTSTDEAVHMAEELTKELGNSFWVDLVGFGSSGVNIGKLAGGFAPAEKLGGRKGLKKLSEAFFGLGLDWYMDFDLVAFNRSSNGFSKGADAAVLPGGQTAWFSSFDTVTREKNKERLYLLARNRMADAASLLVEKASDGGLTGISLDSLSHTVYSDYTDAAAGICEGMPDAVAAAFRTVSQNGFRVLADAPHEYAALCANAVIDAPLYSSGYDFSMADIPFYEMVFKGYVPMSSVSINLCPDETKALLRCVEGGIAPSYTLIHNYESRLITSQYPFIYAADFEGNRQSAVDAIQSVAGYLESIRGAVIDGYSWRGEIRVTHFDNGVYAAVNYGTESVQTEYGLLPGRSFITGKDAL